MSLLQRFLKEAGGQVVDSTGTSDTLKKAEGDFLQKYGVAGRSGRRGGGKLAEEANDFDSHTAAAKYHQGMADKETGMASDLHQDAADAHKDAAKAYVDGDVKTGGETKTYKTTKDNAQQASKEANAASRIQHS